MMQKVINYRGKLSKTLDSIRKGSLTIGFLGGSITDPRGRSNWPEPVTSWFVEKFPDVRIVVENAALGATGSDLAVFRAESDIIGRECDLVFVEYAVNDYLDTTERRMKTREGLIRKLLAGEGRDIVLVYTYRQEMYEDMVNGRIPLSISEFEELGEHYGLGSVWMGLYALNEIRKGRMRWEEWLPDGLHPQNRGSLSYGQSVNEFLEKELLLNPSSNVIKAGAEIPAPLNPLNWENTYNVPFKDIKTTGPWIIHRWAEFRPIDQCLSTSAVGARLAFTFDGRGLVLGLDFGKSSAEFKYNLDDGGWNDFILERPDWCPVSGWYRLVDITDSLPSGKHKFELEVIHGNRPDCTGTNFNLGLVGVIR